MKVKSVGSALLSALFIMTLIAIAATAMSTRLQLDIYRTRLVIQSDKAFLASQAVAFWAMDLLSKPNQIHPFIALDKDGSIQQFPKSLATLYPDSIIEGRLYDLQSLFNLNSLQKMPFQGLFLNVLKNNLTDVDLTFEKMLVAATVAWITPYQLTKDQDEWSSFYAQQDPPYLPADQPMQSVSEFRLVAGVTQTIYQTLFPYLTALPDVTAINVNTAPKQVLMALGQGLTEEQALGIINQRQTNEGFVASDLKELLDKYKIPKEQLGVDSQFFLSVASVKSSDLTLTRYTIIQRQVDRKSGISLHLLSETINAD